MATRNNPTRRDFTQAPRAGTLGPQSAMKPSAGGGPQSFGSAGGFKASSIAGTVAKGVWKTGWGATRLASNLVPRQWRYAAGVGIPLAGAAYGASTLANVNAGTRHAMADAQRANVMLQTAVPEHLRQQTIRQGSGFIRPSDYRRMHGMYEPQQQTQAWAYRPTTPQYQAPKATAAGYSLGQAS